MAKQISRNSIEWWMTPLVASTKWKAELDRQFFLKEGGKDIATDPEFLERVQEYVCDELRQLGYEIVE